MMLLNEILANSKLRIDTFKNILKFLKVVTFWVGKALKLCNLEKLTYILLFMIHSFIMQQSCNLMSKNRYQRGFAKLLV